MHDFSSHSYTLFASIINVSYQNFQSTPFAGDKRACVREYTPCLVLGCSTVKKGLPRKIGCCFPVVTDQLVINQSNTLSELTTTYVSPNVSYLMDTITIKYCWNGLLRKKNLNFLWAFFRKGFKLDFHLFSSEEMWRKKMVKPVILGPFPIFRQWSENDKNIITVLAHSVFWYILGFFEQEATFWVCIPI